MRTLAHTSVRPTTRRVATVALVALAAVATAPSAMAAETTTGGTVPAAAQTVVDLEQEARQLVEDLIGTLGHTWGN